MLSPDLRRRAVEIGFFVMPIVLVQISGLVLGTGGPEAAEAAGEETTPAPPAVTMRETIVWSDAELAAGARARELSEQPITRSPMYYELRPVETTDRPVDPPRFNPLQVTLNGIMKSDTDVFALIDDRAYVIGDTVGPDAWTIVSIDTGQRSVTFRHEQTGEVAKLVVPTRGK